ncbi:class D beta-lactamase [Emticicia sp. BO119]|uniref:class D beta-lactamase n=1 Tax=Emticicia sp. BO119 TaxID=2757768 RepID=UPI0015F0305E|nr:class D beta-lactamase [Emticicia sp. BO119]MBA4852481.1 class D beta-lactamase [Emticicia sp. BO119]
MKATFLLITLLNSFQTFAQIDFTTPFKDCNIEGSTSVYDYKNKKWVFSNSNDARIETLPASTFKIINLLIALETQVIKDENEIVKWVGKTDTTLYGYRPDIYKDMSVKEAFEVSAGWVFIELAKKIGKEKYKHYLKICQYGNGNLSQNDADFWNFGNFAISPINQIEFLIKVYEEKLPFSKKNMEILKKVMITEKTYAYSIRSKTGWTRVSSQDIGWWVGYIERNDNTYFFATRITKKRSTINPEFGQCRKDITKNILRQLNVIE